MSPDTASAVVQAICVAIVVICSLFIVVAVAASLPSVTIIGFGTCMLIAWLIAGAVWWFYA